MLLAFLRAIFASRASLVAENLAPRKPKNPAASRGSGHLEPPAGMLAGFDRSPKPPLNETRAASAGASGADEVFGRGRGRKGERPTAAGLRRGGRAVACTTARPTDNQMEPAE